MAKYAILFAYSDDAVHNMLQHPSDRATAVKALIEGAGGQLDDFFWMLGPYDGIAIADMPDAQAIAATALAVISTHALKRFETYELIPHADIAAIEEKARNIRQSYQPPGEEK